MTEEELKQIDEEAGVVGQAAELLMNPSTVSVSTGAHRYLREADVLDSGENTIGSSEGADVKLFGGCWKTFD